MHHCKITKTNTKFKKPEQTAIYREASERAGSHVFSKDKLAISKDNQITLSTNNTTSSQMKDSTQVSAVTDRPMQRAALRQTAKFKNGHVTITTPI